MDEETKENLDAEVQDVEDTDETGETKNDEAQKKFEDQKRRAEKAEKKAKELEDRLSNIEQKFAPSETKEEDVDDFTALYDKVSVLKDLSQDEYAELSAQAANLGTTPDKLASSEMWKGRLKSLREEAKAKAVTPEPSSRSPRVGNKTFTEMSSEERKKSWEQLRDAVRNQ